MEFVAGRREVLAYRQDYHGHAGFAALVTGSPGENVNDYYNLPREHGRFFDAHGDLAAVENLFDRDIAAVIVEPMDYETFAPPPSFLPGLADPAHHAAIGPARGVVIARSRLSWMSSRPLASRPSTGERTAPPRPRWVFPPRSA